MRTSILQVFSADLAAVVTGLDEPEVTRLGAAAERLTLLTRPSRASRGSQRYHPLVREFLEARLRSTIGDAALAALHRRAGDAASAHDWRVAAHHYREAGDPRSVASTIAAAIPEIMGSGQHAAAIAEIDQVPLDARLPILSLVQSRAQMQRREDTSAVDLSHSILSEFEPGSRESDYALLNMMSSHWQAGMSELALPLTDRLWKTTSSEQLRRIAEGMTLMIDASRDGSVLALSKHLEAMAETQRGLHPHYFGVTMLNLAINAVVQDEPARARTVAQEAIDALEGTSSRIELAAALMAQASAFALLGMAGDAQGTMDRVMSFDKEEALYERGELLDAFIDPDSADDWISLLSETPGRSARSHYLLSRSWFLARRGQYDDAQRLIDEIVSQPQSIFVGQKCLELTISSYVAIASGRGDGHDLAVGAREAALAQGAWRWMRVADLLASFSNADSDFGSTIKRVGVHSPWNVTSLADLVVRRLDEFDDSVLNVIGTASRQHPGRWRYELRRQLSLNGTGEGLQAARLLEPIGDHSDIQRLRAFARRHRKLPGASSLGRGLARQLADRVMVEDQNRVSIAIGARVVAGSSIRRRASRSSCASS